MPFFERFPTQYYQIENYEALRAQKKNRPIQKRSSLLPSFRGSMALEAAFIIPLFLLFMLTIMTSFDILRLHGSLIAGLYQAGNEVSFHGYGIRSAASDGEGNISAVASLLLVPQRRQRVIELVGREYLDETCLVSGTSGLDFSRSSIMEKEDVVELRISYRVRPLFNLLGFQDMKMEASYYARAWTGYDVESRAGGMFEDPIVFIAKTGTVYHTDRGCTYLNPSIRVVSAAELSDERNESGGKYSQCKSCAFYQYQAVCYLTEYGDKYHGTLDCSGISRTVYEVPLSQAGGKSCCGKCKN